MLNNLSTTQKLNRIKDLLNHPAIDCEDLLRKVRVLLRDIRYQKRPIIYRTSSLVRATRNPSEEWFDNVSKFGHPTKEILAKYGRFGRCNWPTDPIFYCSSENGIPVFEVRPAIGDYIVLSNWSNKRGGRIEFSGMAIGAKTIVGALQDNHPFIKLLSRDEVFSDSDNESIAEIDSFLGQLFVEDVAHNEKLYQLTSSIVKSLLVYLASPSGKRLDGLLYPSVAGNLSGFNIVLTTNYVENNLKPSEARMYRILDHSEEANQYVLQPIKRVKGSYSSGELVWESVTQEIANQQWVLSPDSPVIKIN